jgi:hypothetical protein
MAKSGISKKLDTVLEPLGFQRRRATWNRRVAAGLVDVVDVQVSKNGSSSTVNAGVFHPTCYQQCWPSSLPDFIEEPMCTVRARIGDLIHSADGRDVWWARGDPAAEDEIVENVRKHVLPFLERMHSNDAMERFLSDAQVTKKFYPPPVIYLATLKYERGDLAGACTVIREFRTKVRGAWKETVADLAARMGCA